MYLSSASKMFVFWFSWSPFAVNRMCSESGYLKISPWALGICENGLRTNQ